MTNNKSIKDLYNGLKPVLLAKQTEMITLGFSKVDIDIIWSYLLNKCWSNKDITFDQMVDDILNTPSYLFNDYLLEYTRKHKSNNNFENVL